MTPDDQPDLDPVLADAVRRAYVRPVDDVTAQRHVSAIVAAATTVGEEPTVRRARRRRVWRPVLAAAAATLLLPVGMAAAGVDLPDVVEDPYRSIGVTLPHQTRQAQTPFAPGARPSAPGPTLKRRGEKQRRRDPQAAQPNPGNGPRQDKPGGRAGRKNESSGVRPLRPPNPNGRAQPGGRTPTPPSGGRGPAKTRPQRPSRRPR